MTAQGSTRVSSGDIELRTECRKVQFRHFLIELLRQEADVNRERLV